MYFKRWCTLTLFSSASLYVIVRGLCSLPSVQLLLCLTVVCPTCIHRISLFPISLLFFFHDRSTKFLDSAVFPVHLILPQALCFPLAFNLWTWGSGLPKLEALHWLTTSQATDSPAPSNQIELLSFSFKCWLSYVKFLRPSLTLQLFYTKPESIPGKKPCPW